MLNQPATDTPTPAPDDGPLVTQPTDADEKQRKKKAKVRSAWISFVGRIVAQFVGASATVVLALMLLQSHQARSGANEGDAILPAAAPDVVPASVERVRRTADIDSIAVLPLDNFSGDSRNDAVARAITEALIAALSNEQGVTVISRTSSAYYGKLQGPMTDLARRMGVDWVVEGSLVCSGGRLRVIVQLIDAPADEHAWSETYDRTLTDPLSLQSSLAPPIAHDIAQVLADRRYRPAGNGREGDGPPLPAASTGALRR
jgi:TolB-like protein